ncbi:7514_t:CDS:2, partial [Entrophospora sp. SA101]
FTMTEKLMPLLRGIKTKEPSVMVNTLAVYEEMGKNMEKDVLATEIIPHLWKLSIFQKFMKVIKGLSQKVENLHSRQLQDIRSIEDNSKKHLEGGKGTNDEKSVPVDFEKLVGSTGSGDINNNYSSAGGNIGSIEISPDPFDKPGANSVPIFISSLASSNKTSQFTSKLLPPTTTSNNIQASFLLEFKWDEVLHLWEVLWSDHLSSQFHLFVALAILDKHKMAIVEHLHRFDEILKYVNDLSMTIPIDETLL